MFEIMKRTGITEEDEAALNAKEAERRPVALDPFMGSGTTIAVAEKLGYNWIGVDNNPDAVKVTEERLKKIWQERRENEQRQR